MLEKVRPAESVQEWWEETSTTILRVGQDVLGMPTGRRSQYIRRHGGGTIRRDNGQERGKEHVGNIGKAI